MTYRVGCMSKAILKLEDAGFDRKQVEALADYMDADRVTKADVMEVKGELNLLKWMVGLSIALSIAILIKLLAP